MNAPAILAGQFDSAPHAREFTLAGNAHLTLRSAVSGARYTFKVRKADDDEPKWFVSLLDGPDNESSYHYAGLLVRDRDGRFALKLTRASKMNDDSPPVKAFRFFVGWVLNADKVPDQLEVFHEGRCGRCARLLTVPESIARGLGPDCAQIMGVAS